MGAEDWMLRNIDRRREHREEFSPIMERAHEKAHELFRDPDYAIQSADFIDLYGTVQVQADVHKAQEKMRQFRLTDTPIERNSKKIADVLEAIVLEESEMSEWLGNATTLHTTPYDDIVNHVDMLAEWYTPQDGSRLMALAVDVTFGTQTADQKLLNIKKEIDSGALGRVKYFKDARGSFKGTRYNVPRSIIGVSQKTVEDLAQLWVNGEKKQLGGHPVQKVFVGQMHSQLLLMRDYAHRNGQASVAQAYDEALSAVSPVHSSKLDIDATHIQKDPVVAALADKTRLIFGAR